MNRLCLLGPGSPEHNLEKRDDGPGGAGVVCLVEESGHRAAKQRSNPVDPVAGEVAKDSSRTEAVGWLVINQGDLNQGRRRTFLLLLK